MPVPNTFATATAPIPLSQLDTNFATPITLGNTAIQLGNTVSTLNNMTLANVTVTSGNVTITNVTVTTANVTTANIATAQIANVTVSGTSTFAAGSNTAPSITTSGDTNTGIFFPAADTIAFTEGGVESMRIDSAGNVGIGTTSPLMGLELRRSAGNLCYGGLDGNISQFLIRGNLYYNIPNLREQPIVTGWQTQIVLDNSNGSIQFSTSTSSVAVGSASTITERMRLDSSGNLGLGVTPSAWASTAKAFTVKSSGSGIEGSIANSGATNAISLVSNGYYNAGWKYVYSGGSFSAGRYDIEGAGHSWYTAASGTAGNAITFTQAMTLDANNVLYVNGTSQIAGSILNVRGNGSYIGVGGSTVQMLFGDNNSLNGFLGTLTNHDLTIRTNNTERARVDASGFTQFSSNLVMPYQGAPTSKAAAATLSGAELITGILSYTGAAATVNLPTGTNIEGALTWSANNVSLDWYVINTGSGTCTIGANGNTTLGALTVAAATSAQFRIRRTAANTFTVYRLG